MSEPTHLKIRYRGQLIGGKWIYSRPKIVELPIPFVSKSEKTGEVCCDPVGTFEYADGMKLLELSGENGPFVLEEELYDGDAMTGREIVDVLNDPTVRVEVETPEEREQRLLRKRINYAKRTRGKRQRARRSDAGVPRQRKQIAADTPVQAQADSEPSPQVAAG